MKYKLLLTGTNQTLISDFFLHMNVGFECMYSSVRDADVLCHLKYFHPDAVVFCLHKDHKSDINGFGAVLPELASEKIPLIIVGEDQNCNLFERTLPMAADLMIRRPITTKELEEELYSYLERIAEQQKKDAELNQTGEEEKNQTDNSSAEESANAKEEEKRHILIVDDDSNVLKMVKGYLGSQFNVATAISGKVALKFLEKRKTDLILLDYEMPGQNGVQVLQKIRNDERLKDLPVVFLTGMTDREQIKQVLEYKPQGYLLKPIDAEKLFHALNSILMPG